MMEVNQKSSKLFNFRYVFLLSCVVPETICDHIMGLIAWIRDNKPVTKQPIITSTLKSLAIRAIWLAISSVIYS